MKRDAVPQLGNTNTRDPLAELQGPLASARLRWTARVHVAACLSAAQLLPFSSFGIVAGIKAGLLDTSEKTMKSSGYAQSRVRKV